MGQEVVAEKGTFGQYDKCKYFGRRKAAVVLRKVYVLLAVNTVPSRSLRFPYVSQLSAGFLQKNYTCLIFLRTCTERVEGHGNAWFIWRYICGFLRFCAGCRTAA